MNYLLRSVILAAFSYTGAVFLFQTLGSRAFSHVFMSLVVFWLGIRSGTERELLPRYMKAFSLALAFFVTNLFFIDNLDVLVGPDETRFNQNYFSFIVNPIDYFKEAITSLQEGYVVLSSSYPILGSIVYPIFYISGNYDPQLATFLNLSLLIGVVAYLLGRFQDLKWPALLLLVSPQLLYHCNVYAKDILTLTLTGLAFLFFHQKRYALFIVFAILCSALRPYALPVIFIYYSAFFLNKKIIYSGVAGSAAICLAFAGPTGLANAGLISQYLIMSPNPFSFQIERPDYLPLYIESWTLCIAYSLVIIGAIRIKSMRELFSRFLAGLIIYACIMTTLGLYGSIAYGFEYEAGSLSANIVRKKSMMMPFIYICLFSLLGQIFARRSKDPHFLSKNGEAAHVR